METFGGKDNGQELIDDLRRRREELEERMGMRMPWEARSQAVKKAFDSAKERNNDLRAFGKQIAQELGAPRRRAQREEEDRRISGRKKDLISSMKRHWSGAESRPTAKQVRSSEQLARHQGTATNFWTNPQGEREIQSDYDHDGGNNQSRPPGGEELPLHGRRAKEDVPVARYSTCEEKSETKCQEKLVDEKESDSLSAGNDKSHPDELKAPYQLSEDGAGAKSSDAQEYESCSADKDKPDRDESKADYEHPVEGPGGGRALFIASEPKVKSEQDEPTARYEVQKEALGGESSDGQESESGSADKDKADQDEPTARYEGQEQAPGGELSDGQESESGSADKGKDDQDEPTARYELPEEGAGEGSAQLTGSKQKVASLSEENYADDSSSGVADEDTSQPPGEHQAQSTAQPLERAQMEQAGTENTPGTLRDSHSFSSSRENPSAGFKYRHSQKDEQGTREATVEPLTERSRPQLNFKRHSGRQRGKRNKPTLSSLLGQGFGSGVEGEDASGSSSAKGQPEAGIRVISSTNRASRLPSEGLSKSMNEEAGGRQPESLDDAEFDF